MKRKEFFDYVKANVKEYLPEAYAYADIRLHEVKIQNGRSLTAIVFPVAGSNVTPNIYLDSIYEEYIDGKNLDICVGDVADLWTEKMDPDLNINVNEFLDYDHVKEKLQVRVCDAETNKEWLQSKPHTIHGDFAAYYTINLQENEDGVASATVTSALLEAWQIDLSTLHQDAMNADLKRVPVLHSMDDLIGSMVFGIGTAENLLGKQIDASAFKPPLFCLTNENRMNGAGLILNEDIRRQVADFMKCDFYVLPSSIHEILVVPADEATELQELCDMVKGINESEVSIEERLSDHVQFCDEKTAVMENAQLHEEKLRQKNREMKAEKGGIRSKLEKAKEEVKAGELLGTSEKKMKDASLAI